MKPASVAACCLLPLLLSAAPALTEAPPAALAGYVADGLLKPGEFGWLRGAFTDATPAEVAAYRTITAWRERCHARDTVTTRAELVALGITPASSVDHLPYRTLLCGQVGAVPEPLDLTDWPGFARDVAVVRPIAQSYLAAVAAAERGVGASNPAVRDSLVTRVGGEQALRAGLGWAQGDEAGTPPAMLTAQQRGILDATLTIALEVRDRANTDWLKEVVARQGWPKRSEVGDTAARKAWLLVQHADAEPAFQVRVLRLMEPLVKAGEAHATDYAYLYDRTMLVVTGRQRYATQLTCRGGRYMPLPLEDEGAMEARRKEADMEPFAVYQTRSTQVLGPCHNAPGGD